LYDSVPNDSFVDIYSPEAGLGWEVMLTLPLWIVTEHIQPSEPEHTPEHEPGSALAFSSSGKLFKFMKAHLGGEWKMQMAADRDGLVVLIADLHRLQIANLVLDPDDDAEQLALADLMSFADSLR
jgi:hypothetical protein